MLLGVLYNGEAWRKVFLLLLAHLFYLILPQRSTPLSTLCFTVAQLFG
jgi:hypothetical protein